MKLNRLPLLALSLLLFAACEKDEDVTPVQPEEGTYSEGIFVLNEGNYGLGNSTVSFLNPETEEMYYSLFSAENSGEELGDTGQSIGFYKDYAFIIMNVSNKIEVVDRHNFEKVGTITSGLDNPRYIAFSEDKAYVTNWGDGTNPDDDFVAVIDAENFSVSTTIEVAEGPEEIVAAGGKIYVAHPGGFSFSNKISVINSETASVEKEIEVGDVPNSLEVSGDFLWVASSGLPSYAETETSGEITQIDLNSNEIVSEYEFEGNTMHPNNLEIENGQIYFTLGKQVFLTSTENTGIPGEAFISLEEVGVLYGFEVENGKIYAASANSDFTGDGDLFIYEAGSGELLESYKTGINPNGIYFNQ